jgi:hypothetical protein
MAIFLKFVLAREGAGLIKRKIPLDARDKEIIVNLPDRRKFYLCGG